MGSQVGWVCSFCSCSLAPLGKPATLSHTLLAPTLLHSSLNPSTSSSRSPPPAIVICSCFPQGLTTNPMRKSLGRKVSLPRYLAAHLHPRLGTGRHCALPGEERPRPECQLVPVYWSICLTTDGLVRPVGPSCAQGHRNNSQSCRIQKACRVRSTSLNPTSSWTGFWKGCGMCGERTDLSREGTDPR